MRYHFGYGVGHVYGHTVRQPAAAPISEHETTHHDPPAPSASHTSNTPPAAACPLESYRRDLGQDVASGLEAEPGSESDYLMDLDNEDSDDDSDEDSDEEASDDGDGAEVGEDLDFRNLDDIEELFSEEMYV